MKTSTIPANPTPAAPKRENERCTPVLAPAKLRRDIPLSDAARRTIGRARSEIGAILSGADSERLLVVCGPCSIDDVNAALVYAERLRRLSEELSDRLLVVMRTYVEKPRSVVGWKGLAYDPLVERKAAPSAGFAIARRLMARINDLGLPCASEFLNPMVAMYLEDCIAYGSIGSRTVESQIHRELASRLALPIGMKNGMDGSIESAANGVRSARSPHAFYGQSLGGEPCLVETDGNPEAHLILRGGTNGPNYDEGTTRRAAEIGKSLGLARPVVVDCSHGNSGKDHRRQPSVANEVARQARGGGSGVAGLMLESYLVEGRQDASAGPPRVFGQSVTDACMGWSDTEKTLRFLAE